MKWGRLQNVRHFAEEIKDLWQCLKIELKPRERPANTRMQLLRSVFQLCSRRWKQLLKCDYNPNETHESKKDYNS